MSNRTVPATAEGMPNITRREALCTLAAGGAAGALAAGVVVVAIPAPATAEPIGDEVAPEAADPMLELATAYTAANVALNDSDITDAKEVDEYCAVHIDPLRDRITEGAPTPTTMAGLIATLRLAERGMGQGDLELAEPLVQAAVRFFDGRAA